jgi:hypothetical protein
MHYRANTLLKAFCVTLYEFGGSCGLRQHDLSRLSTLLASSVSATEIEKSEGEVVHQFQSRRRRQGGESDSGLKFEAGCIYAVTSRSKICRGCTTRSFEGGSSITGVFTDRRSIRLRQLDRSLARWAYRKYKKLSGHLRGATHWVAHISRRSAIVGALAGGCAARLMVGAV